jgi:hypothetical protein
MSAHVAGPSVLPRPSRGGRRGVDRAALGVLRLGVLAGLVALTTMLWRIGASLTGY